MSKLYKLSIKGIRSFSPRENNVIEFETPLTLIVGANGTGKTTVIECLKYATTGDMPPNSRGGAFIFDPKIAGEVDVKAEVKLKFYNPNNDLFTVSRSMQSTVKRGKAEQKTLECLLTKQECNSYNSISIDDIENNRNSTNANKSSNKKLISSKIADIDKAIPQHLCVSHSILENVIFCHQDESTWPIGDPTQMKKKLDEIFNSNEYNKALLSLKSVKKEVTADLKLKTQESGFYLKEKMKKDELSQNIKKYQEDIDNKQNKLSILSDEIKKISKNIEKMAQEKKIYEKLSENYKILKNELDRHQSYVKSFSKKTIEISNQDIIENVANEKVKAIATGKSRAKKAKTNPDDDSIIDPECDPEPDNDMARVYNPEDLIKLEEDKQLLLKIEYLKSKRDRVKASISETESEILELKALPIEQEFLQIEKLYKGFIERQKQHLEIQEKIKDYKNEEKALVKERELLLNFFTSQFSISNISDADSTKISETIKESFDKAENILLTKKEKIDGEKKKLAFIKEQERNFEYFRESLQSFLDTNKDVKVNLNLDKKLYDMKQNGQLAHCLEVNEKDNAIKPSCLVELVKQEIEPRILDLKEMQLETEAIYDEINEDMNNKQEELTTAYKLSEAALKKQHLTDTVNKLKVDIKLNTEVINQSNSFVTKVTKIYNDHKMEIMLDTNASPTINYEKYINLIKSIKANISEQINKISSERHKYSINKEQRDTLVIKILQNINTELNYIGLELLINKNNFAVTELATEKALKDSGSSKFVEISNFINKNSDNTDVLSELAKRVKEMIKLEDLYNCDDIHSKLLEIKDLNSVSSHADKIYKNFIDIGIKKSSCPLCLTSLNDKAKSDFVSRLQKVITKLPEMSEQQSKKAKFLEEKFEELKTSNIAIEVRNKTKLKIFELLDSLASVQLSHFDSLSEISASLNFYIDGIELMNEFRNNIPNDRDLIEKLQNTNMANSSKSIIEFLKFVQKKLEDLLSNADIIIEKLKRNKNEVELKENQIYEIESEIAEIPAAVNVDKIKDQLALFKEKFAKTKEDLSLINKKLQEIEEIKKEILGEIKVREMLQEKEQKLSTLQNYNIKVPVEIFPDADFETLANRDVSDINNDRSENKSIPNPRSSLNSSAEGHLNDFSSNHNLGYSYNINAGNRDDNYLSTTQNNRINLPSNRISVNYDKFKQLIHIKEIEQNLQTMQLKFDKSNNKFIKLKVEADMKLNRLKGIENQTCLIKRKLDDLLSKISSISSNQTFKFCAVEYKVDEIFSSNHSNLDYIRGKDCKFVDILHSVSVKSFEDIKTLIFEYKNTCFSLNKKISELRGSMDDFEQNMNLLHSKIKIYLIGVEISQMPINDLKKHSENLSILENRREKILSSYNLIKGEIKQMSNILQSLNTEMEQYTNSVKNYISSLVEIKALEYSLDDLDKCISGLDKAIVEFHSVKIAEVNQILKDLWTNTYKGDDIDYIELKSECASNNSRNYFLVMIKNGVELEMRGRSSAGQKMIASILFRLALAEAFSQSCNILALDEPTTNLDYENVQSLALTLSSIIKQRSNFQMIVITHDEEFVNLLNREGTEHFYRIKRDDKGQSSINRHSIY